MLNKVDAHKNVFYKFEKNLSYRKEELFKLKNASKWDLSPEELQKPNLSFLYTNKELAFTKMCHKVLNQ